MQTTPESENSTSMSDFLSNYLHRDLINIVRDMLPAEDRGNFDKTGIKDHFPYSQRQFKEDEAHFETYLKSFLNQNKDKEGINSTQINSTHKYFQNFFSEMIGHFENLETSEAKEAFYGELLKKAEESSLSYLLCFILNPDRAEQSLCQAKRSPCMDEAFENLPTIQTLVSEVMDIRKKILNDDDDNEIIELMTANPAAASIPIFKGLPLRKTLLTSLIKKCRNENFPINLSWAALLDADLSNADLSNANLSRTNLSHAVLLDADLSGANLHRANLHLAHLSNADLSGANLHWANLANASLMQVKLEQADLSHATLSGASLQTAKLHEADLRGAKLIGTNLTSADLRGADLRGADLRGADLRGAKLIGTNLTNADLRGADLRGTRHAKIHLSNIKIDDCTQLPETLQNSSDNIFTTIEKNLFRLFDLSRKRFQIGTEKKLHKLLKAYERTLQEMQNQNIEERDQESFLKEHLDTRYEGLPSISEAARQHRNLLSQFFFSSTRTTSTLSNQDESLGNRPANYTLSGSKIIH